MRGKLVGETDVHGMQTGKKVCVSCQLWNCWHDPEKRCDIDGCECTRSHPG